MRSLVFGLILSALSGLSFAGEADLAEPEADFEIVEVVHSPMILAMKARFEEIKGIEVEIVLVSDIQATVASHPNFIPKASVTAEKPTIDLRDLPPLRQDQPTQTTLDLNAFDRLKVGKSAFNTLRSGQTKPSENKRLEYPPNYRVRTGPITGGIDAKIGNTPEELEALRKRGIDVQADIDIGHIHGGMGSKLEIGGVEFD